MAGKGSRDRTPGEFLMTSILVAVVVCLAVPLIRNQEGVKQRAAEFDQVQKDIVQLAEEIQRHPETEKGRMGRPIEQERLARERLHWARPGDYIVRIREE